ncbi:helix-turn-helix transcriptional regulator [Paenibacillus roseipurpureus]|uniref:AraC family transcriptional regulator n=1 Tax=Paenibacillus roseopurpureus TaxID=2918901 RepID=A0AA96LVF3_9BACL|nr:AraC family transcriptional regulator [Paenibacillus sp. MBLB1832]WNR46813.1 AraC family transcriptional regulator [Paenibacillus sp. MBLB1832]
MIRFEQLPLSDLDHLFLSTHLQCVYMHLAEQDDRWECTRHTHDHIEFGYIHKGHGQYHIGEIEYRAETGDIFVIPPGVTHFEVHDAEHPFEIMFLMVKHHGDRAAELSQLMERLQGKIRAKQQHKLKQIMNDIYAEIMNREQGYVSSIDAKLKTLYVQLQREVFPHQPRLAAPSAFAANEERNSIILTEIKEFVSSHLDQKCTVAQVAQHFFYHPKYVSLLFKKETGQSLSDYIMAAKLERARELLTQTNESVETIANMLGFSSLQHLYKWFKQHTSITPLQYRNQYKSSKSNQSEQ